MHQCGYLDLSAIGLEKVDKIDQAWAKEVNDGLADCGRLQFRWNGKSGIVLDRARADLTGDTVLSMATASRLIDPEWEKQKQLHDRDQGGLMLNRAESLYFLHTVERDAAPENKTPLDEIGAYVVTYADGAVERVDIDAGRNINFRDMTQDADNAKHVGQGFYVGRWINPYPERAIKSVGIELKNDTARLILLGVTSTLVREKIHD
jgi:hypothetical protein